MERESRGLVHCSPVNHTDLHLITQPYINYTALLLYCFIAVFYAETISGIIVMQLPFEECGTCLTSHSSAEQG